ncbi:MAG: pantoate--beta-alanine ligase [Bacteroidales bacterium]|nr:pantoate--beta-alanine ligase [Candidatus Latescibacterota bacterium]
MKKVTTPAQVRKAINKAQGKGLSVGLVPTMGALHEGHESLVRMSLDETDFTVVSIFVNPVQFGSDEDLATYPRSLDDDTLILEKLGVDLLFAPEVTSIYSGEEATEFRVEGLGDRLCGATRPGHFQGVLLVVAKLFNMVRPDFAFFGQKDAQQAVIIQRMVADLDFPVRIRLGHTVRESDGLAMSSRNAHLNGNERKSAVALSRGLRLAFEKAKGGERDAGVIMDVVRSSMESGGFDVDYCEVVSGMDLKRLERLEGTVLFAAAGRLGKTRLIDNISLRIKGESVTEAVLEFPEWSRYEWK